jgi:hypothetical protein
MATFNWRRIPKRFAVYAVLLLAVALLPFWPGPRPGMVSLHGSPEEMGRQYGTACNWSIPLLPFLITLSSAREGRAGVFEPFDGGMRERTWAGDRVCAANDTWGRNDVQDSVATTVRQAELHTVADVRRLLAADGVLLACNIYSVVFDFTGNRLYLASGRMPAAKRPAREFTLF